MNILKMDSRKRVNKLAGKILIIETNRINSLLSTFLNTVYVTEIRKFKSEIALLEFVKSLKFNDINNVYMSDNKGIVKTNLTHLTSKGGLKMIITDFWEGLQIVIIGSFVLLPFGMLYILNIKNKGGKK